MKYLILSILFVLISGCGKLGASGTVNQWLGNWAEVKLPAGCEPKQIVAEESSGVAVLCTNGKVYH
jgi:hypothetical protein